MPTIYAATTDNRLEGGPNSSWDGVRDATAAVLSSATDASSNVAVGSAIFTGRGAASFKIWRSFFNCS